MKYAKQTKESTMVHCMGDCHIGDSPSLLALCACHSVFMITWLMPCSSPLFQDQEAMGSNPSCCQEEPATEVIQPEILHCRADHPDDHAGDHADSQKGPKDHESNELVVQDAHTTGSEEVSRPPSKRSRLQKMGHLVVDWEILRGIDLRETFVRRGSLWRSSPMDLPLERREQLWHLSRPVDGFDIFLSHTWLTAGKWKILALVLQSSWKTGLSCWGGSVCLALLLCAMDILPMPGLVYVDTAGFKATCPLGAWIVVFGFFGTIFGVVLSVYTPRWWSSSGTCFFDVVACLNSGENPTRPKLQTPKTIISRLPDHQRKM